MSVRLDPIGSIVYRVTLGLGPILEHHNVFQWDGAAAAAAAADA